MNEQIAEQPTLTRKLTDGALILIAVAAVASWLWRRLRRPTTVSPIAPVDHGLIDEKIGAAVGFPATPPS